MISGEDVVGGGTAPAREGEFDQFLAQLAGAVTERIRSLSPDDVARPDPAFLDEAKTIVEWPELTAYIIEELR